MLGALENQLHKLGQLNNEIENLACGSDLRWCLGDYRGGAYEKRVFRPFLNCVVFDISKNCLGRRMIFSIDIIHFNLKNHAKVPFGFVCSFNMTHV